MKKNRILEAEVDDGVFECPHCNQPTYLDAFDLSKLYIKGSMVIPCPECNNKVRLIYNRYYEQEDYNSEL